MKRSQELLGIPIFSISEGVQIGTVKGLLINPCEKNVEFLLIDEPGASEELRGISFLSANAIGDFAITVEKDCGVIDLLKVKVLKNLVDVGLDIFGKKVVSNKGAYIGDVSEYSINTEDGNIAEFFYRTEGNNETEYALSAEQVITIGKEALIIDDSIAAGTTTSDPVKQEEQEPASTPQEELRNFKEGDEGTPELTEEVDIVTTEETTAVETEIPVVEVPLDASAKEEVQDPVAIENDDIGEEIEIEKSAEPEAGSKQETSEGQEKTLSKLVQQQRQYILGKTLIRDIKDENGEILARENEKVTDEIFYRLYSAGPQKIVEAMTYVKD